MALDTFTDHLLMETLKRRARTIEEVCDIANMLCNSRGSGPSKEAIAFFEENKGKDVLINGTSYEGTIHGLNTATNGFYPGNRYPIYVMITGSSNPIWEKSVGSIFEYDIDQLTILEEV